MAQKIFVSYPGSLSKDLTASKKQSVADTLGVCPEDVVLIPDGLAVSVVEVPDAMIKDRQKADKKAADEAEKAAEEQQAAELEAVQAQQAEAARTQQEKQAEAARATADKAQNTQDVRKSTAAAETAAPDYDSWTLEQLHAEAAKRDLHGRSGLDKAGLVKAFQKADRKA